MTRNKIMFNLLEKQSEIWKVTSVYYKNVNKGKKKETKERISQNDLIELNSNISLNTIK